MIQKKSKNTQSKSRHRTLFLMLYAERDSVKEKNIVRDKQLPLVSRDQTDESRICSHRYGDAMSEERKWSKTHQVHTIKKKITRVKWEVFNHHNERRFDINKECAENSLRSRRVCYSEAEGKQKG